MTAIPTLPREAVAPPTAPAAENDIECLATEIRSTFWCIKTLCEEFMCQSAEMLGELDEPPPRLIKKRDLVSAAWTSIATLRWCQAVRMHRSGIFTGDRPFPHYFVFSGNPSPEQSGKKPSRPHERMRETTGQLELELDGLTASTTEDDLAGETAPGRTTQVKGFERRRPSRKPFPEHL